MHHRHHLHRIGPDSPLSRTLCGTIRLQVATFATLQLQKICQSNAASYRTIRLHAVGHSPEVLSTCSDVCYSSPPEDPPAQRNFLNNTLLNHPLICSDAATTTTCHSITTLQADLTRFWEIEEGPQVRRLSESDAVCEEHFRRHTTRNSDGRYIVALPFNNKKHQLGEYKTQAEKRLLSLERKLQKNPELRRRYHAVLQEYLDLGHLSEIRQSSQQ